MSRTRKRPLLSGLITFGVIVLLEAFAVMAVATDFSVGPLVDLLLAFAFHLGAAVVVSYGFWGKWDFRYPDEKNWAVIGFVMVLAIPIYGLIGYAGAFAAVHWNRNRRGQSSVVSAFEEHVAFEPEVSEAVRRGPNLLNATPDEREERGAVAPLIDIIKAGDPDLKRGAIFSLSRLNRKTAVKILREALHDIDPDSQFYVAGQLSRIEKELSDQIIRTRRKLELEPDNLELKVLLARYSKEYVESGLVEASVQDYFVRQAIALCEDVLEVDGARLDVLFDLAELYSLAQDHGSAATAWRRILDLDPLDTNAKVGLAHAYFELRDLENLGAILTDLEQAGDTPRTLRPVLDFWHGAQSQAVG